MADFYPDSYSSSSSISSYDSNHINQPELNTISSSSGYDSSLTSIPDHLFPSSSSSNTIIIPDSQFIHLHLDDDRHSSPPSSISSLSSQEPTSTLNSPLYCRKYLQNNQYSSDTDDDSQSTTISTNRLSPQERPRSLPIAIQQLKTVFNEDESVTNSSFYPCTDGLINQKDSLKNFIMSPTDRLKIQMPYQKTDPNKVNFHLF
jgi:hypothetical protein